MPVIDRKTGKTLVDDRPHFLTRHQVAYGPTIGKKHRARYLPWGTARGGAAN